ncbi:hypothetical protein B0T17DRAFT_509502 [Bombardia bombarda]|uniref:Secreted protein n=1 Tax=Bombardia bombarda TaxID=252184 RepID=A0AA40BXZ2_9PEZI|nr:hypothetical protein B0T17DRAFT_509502 [Bombardia bombarda]
MDAPVFAVCVFCVQCVCVVLRLPPLRVPALQHNFGVGLNVGCGLLAGGGFLPRTPSLDVRFKPARKEHHLRSQDQGGYSARLHTLEMQGNGRCIAYSARLAAATSALWSPAEQSLGDWEFGGQSVCMRTL